MKWAPRFSLRTLFILITACALAVFLGLLVHQRGLRQRRAFDEVVRLGGGAGFEPHTVPTYYDWCFRNIAFVGLATSVRDDDLAVLDEFPKLQKLGLTSPSITDRAVPRIARLKQLESLWMQGTAITDEAVPHLAKLKNLKLLDLKETAISDEGAAELRKALPECEVDTHYMRRCRTCREFYTTRRMSKANICPACEEPKATAASDP